MFTARVLRFWPGFLCHITFCSHFSGRDYGHHHFPTGTGAHVKPSHGTLPLHLWLHIQEHGRKDGAVAILPHTPSLKIRISRGKGIL